MVVHYRENEASLCYMKPKKKKPEKNREFVLKKEEREKRMGRTKNSQCIQRQNDDIQVLGW